MCVSRWDIITQIKTLVTTNLKHTLNRGILCRYICFPKSAFNIKYLAKDNGKTWWKSGKMFLGERKSVERHCRFYVLSLLTLHF